MECRIFEDYNSFWILFFISVHLIVQHDTIPTEDEIDHQHARQTNKLEALVRLQWTPDPLHRSTGPTSEITAIRLPTNATASQDLPGENVSLSPTTRTKRPACSSPTPGSTLRHEHTPSLRNWVRARARSKESTSDHRPLLKFPKIKPL